MLHSRLGPLSDGGVGEYSVMAALLPNIYDTVKVYLYFAFAKTN